MTWLREWRFKRNHLRACKRLAQITEAKANSYEIKRYVERRAAALKYSRS